MVVKCFRCGVEGHKCRECPLWVKKERAAHVAMPQKAQQERRPVYPVRGEAQERKLRKVEQEEAAHVAMPQKAQQERRPARPVRGEAQERKLRKVEQEEVARVAKP